MYRFDCLFIIREVCLYLNRTNAEKSDDEISESDSNL